MTHAPGLLGIGGAHVDRRGQVTGIHVPATSNPGTMREDIGGVVFNALRVARGLGLSAAIVSLRGGDGAGERIAQAIAESGIDDLSAVFLDRASASYTALLDREGELITGLADMGLYDLFPRVMRRRNCREAIAGAGAILLDANMPEDAVSAVAGAATCPVYAIGISPAKVVRLAASIVRISCLFLNRREAIALASLPPEADAREIADGLRRIGARAAIVTRGEAPAIVVDGEITATIDPPRPRAIVDVTGAGDAVAGATVEALVRGSSLAEAARRGMAAARLALESRSAVPDLSPEVLAEALAEVPAPEPV